MERTETAGRRFATWAAAILLAVGLALAAAALPGKAYAEDDEAVRDAANGVLKFNWHIDGSDYSRGSCFLINDNTVLTAYHCTMFSTPELEYYGLSGRSVQDLRDHMTYSVNINRDMKVGATLLNYSEEQDFAILKLDQTLNGYKPLKIRDSSTVKPAEVVYSVGFPANNDLTVISTYTASDVTFKRGTVSKAENTYKGWAGNFQVNGYFIQTDSAISGGDSGGPMIDASGNVIGISVMGDSANNFYYAVASDVVTPALDTLGVEYNKAPDTPGPINPSNSASSASSDYKLKFTALDSQISAAETAVSNASTYTEESLKAVNDALAVAREAKSLELESGADEAEYKDKQAEIDDAAANLEKALGGLQQKPAGLPIGAIIGIVVAVVAVIVIIVLVIVMRGRKKKKEGEAAQASAAPAVTPAPPQPSLQAGTSNSSTWQKAPSTGAAADTNETSILTEEADDTIILFQAASGGSLTRMSTNENIPINSAEFTIGRERSKVDYCLEGNSSISRVHVRILVRDGKVLLVDNRAANGTYVNGVKCRPGQEIELKAGDIITLADEKFKYNA